MSHEDLKFNYSCLTHLSLFSVEQENAAIKDLALSRGNLHVVAHPTSAHEAARRVGAVLAASPVLLALVDVLARPVGPHAVALLAVAGGRGLAVRVDSLPALLAAAHRAAVVRLAEVPLVRAVVAVLGPVAHVGGLDAGLALAAAEEAGTRVAVFDAGFA